MYNICTLIVIHFYLIYPKKRQTIVLAINSLNPFSEVLGVYENIYTYKTLMVHTTCLVECLLLPYINILLR